MEQKSQPFRPRPTAENTTQQEPPKAPEQWKTGNEPMTAAQAGYLKTLCRDTGEEFDSALTKAQASKKIQELQQKKGEGKP